MNSMSDRRSLAWLDLWACMLPCWGRTKMCHNRYCVQWISHYIQGMTRSQPSSTPASTFVTRYSLVIEPRTSESICVNGACRWLLPRNSTAELFRKQWPTVSTELPYQMKVSVALWQDTYSCSEDMFRSLYPFPVSITSRKCIRWCLGLWLANWRRPRLEIVQYMATNYVPWEASIPLDSCANMV